MKSSNSWAQDIFPLIGVFFSLLADILEFLHTDLLPPWLNLFLCILFFMMLLLIGLFSYYPFQIVYF